jgi:hypothetical protein
MFNSYPIGYMLVQALLFVVPLSAQFGGRVPDETRAPMAIRSPSGKTCELAVSGNARVGRVSVKGGVIEIRDLSGIGILAVTGTLRFQFANGRYFDYIWRYSSAGLAARSMKLTPEETLFAGGLVAPNRIDSTILGVYWANGEVCGDTGAYLKEKYQKVLESTRLDAEQAIGVANALPPKLFGEAVRDGLFELGPYQRESVAASNSMLKSKLLDANGDLIPEYKEWLKRWQESLKPAKPAPPTRSSRQPAR